MQKIRGFDEQGRKHGRYIRDPLEQDVRVYKCMMKDFEEVKTRITALKQEEGKKKLRPLFKELFLIKSIMKTLDEEKRGKRELFYHHGEKFRARFWSMDGRLIEEHFLEGGQTVLVKKWSGDGFFTVRRGNYAVHKKDDRIILREIRCGDIRKFATYDDDGNIKKLMCRKNGKPFDLKIESDEFDWDLRRVVRTKNI
uniref:Uncharacterized protein n=1 Tax=Marseillevirus sp. TaxID=2809551 RepID=A0AA96ENF7_9VIRU|nr:hypothetical protein MarFTMF_218 [Marseillevirus sp.]